MAISSNLFRSSQVSALSQLRPRGAQSTAPSAPEPADPEVSMRRGTVGHLVNSELADLEAQAQAAGAVGDVDTVRRLTDQMGQLIEGNRKQLSKMASYQGANEGQLAVAQRAGHYLYGDYLHGATDKGRIATKGLAHMMNPDSTEAREFAGYKARTSAISAKLADVRKYGGEYGNAMADSMTLDPMFIQAARGKGAFDPTEVNMLHDAVTVAHKSGGDVETYHVAAKAFRDRFAKNDVAMSAPGAFIKYLTVLEGLAGGSLTGDNINNALARYAKAYTAYSNPDGTASYNAAQKTILTGENALTVGATHADTGLLHDVLAQVNALADEVGIPPGERGSFITYMASPSVYDDLRELAANGVLSAMSVGTTRGALIQNFIKTRSRNEGMSLFAGTEGTPGDPLSSATDFIKQVKGVISVPSILGGTNLSPEDVAKYAKAGAPIPDESRVDRVVETYFQPIANALQTGVHRAMYGFLSRQGSSFNYQGAATLDSFLKDPQATEEITSSLTALGFSDEQAKTFHKVLTDTIKSNPSQPLDIATVVRRMTTVAPAAASSSAMSYFNFSEAYERGPFHTATAADRKTVTTGVAQNVYGWDAKTLEALRVPAGDNGGSINGGEAVTNLLDRVSNLKSIAVGGYGREAATVAEGAVAKAQAARAAYLAAQNKPNDGTDGFTEAPAENAAEKPFELGSLRDYIEDTPNKGMVKDGAGSSKDVLNVDQTGLSLSTILNELEYSSDPYRVQLARRANEAFYDAIQSGDTTQLTRALTDVLAYNRAEGVPKTDEVFARQNKQAVMLSADIGVAWLRDQSPRRLSDDEWKEFDALIKDMRSHMAAPLTTLDKTAYLAECNPMVGGPLGGLSVVLGHYMAVDPAKTARLYNLTAKIIGADDIHVQSVAYGGLTDHFFSSITNDVNDIIVKYNADPYGDFGSFAGFAEAAVGPIAMLSSYGPWVRNGKLKRAAYAGLPAVGAAGGIYNYNNTHELRPGLMSKTSRPVAEKDNAQASKWILPGNARALDMYNNSLTTGETVNMIASPIAVGVTNLLGNKSKSKAAAGAGFTLAGLVVSSLLEEWANEREKDKAYADMVNRIANRAESYGKAIEALSSSGVRNHIGINGSVAGHIVKIRDEANRKDIGDEEKLRNIGGLLSSMQTDVVSQLPYNTAGNAIMEAGRALGVNPTTTPDVNAFSGPTPDDPSARMYAQGAVDRSFVSEDGAAKNMGEAKENLALFRKLSGGEDLRLANAFGQQAIKQLLPSTSAAGHNTELRARAESEVIPHIRDAVAINPNLQYEDVLEFVAKYLVATAKELRAQDQREKLEAQKKKMELAHEFRTRTDETRHQYRMELQKQSHENRKELEEHKVNLKQD